MRAFAYARCGVGSHLKRPCLTSIAFALLALSFSRTAIKMKVIIFGATGFVGSATLQACISDPAITKIVAVSRRELQDSFTQHEKIKVVLHKDFLNWPLEVTEQLSNSRACFWSVAASMKPNLSDRKKVHRWTSYANIEMADARRICSRQRGHYNCSSKGYNQKRFTYASRAAIPLCILQRRFH